MSIYKELLKKFFKEQSKIAFKSTFYVPGGDSYEDNLDAVADKFAEQLSNSSTKLYDIIEKMIDKKIESTIVNHKLVGKSPVHGMIKLKPTKL